MNSGDDTGAKTAVADTIKRELSSLASEVSPVLVHWLDLFRKRGGIPDRRDISPEAMPTALAHVWLCDYSRAEDRFRYRLGGEHVVASLGGRIKGRYLDELTDPLTYPRVHAYFRQCVDRPAVLLISGRIYAEQSRIAIGERLMLPYVDQSETVSGIFGATIREWHDQGRESEPDLGPGSRRHLCIHLDSGRVETEEIPLP